MITPFEMEYFNIYFYDVILMKLLTTAFLPARPYICVYALRLSGMTIRRC